MILIKNPCNQCLININCSTICLDKANQERRMKLITDLLLYIFVALIFWMGVISMWSFVGNVINESLNDTGEVMAYDSSKDIVKSIFVFDDENEKTIIASIYSYNEGEMKLQLGRQYEKNGTKYPNGKLGRLTLDEIKQLRSVLDNVIEEIENI